MEDKQVTGWTGWVALASFVLMFSGIMQAIYGFAALFNQNWYVATSSSVYVFSIATWGWISLALGALLFLTGVLLLNGNLFGRTLGVIFALMGLAANMAFLSVAPIWSTLGIIAYVLVGYAIIAHGSEMKTLSQN